MSEVKQEVMITTKDNPFNPFDEFDEWNNFDIASGYNTCAYIARVAITSTNLSTPDQQVAIEQAMEEILSYNLSGNYVKVTRDL